MKSYQYTRVKRFIVDNIPRVAIYAAQDIFPGTENLYDNGVNDLAWRQSISNQASQDRKY